MRSTAPDRPGGCCDTKVQRKPWCRARWSATCPNWAGKFGWTKRTCMGGFLRAGWVFGKERQGEKVAGGRVDLPGPRTGCPLSAPDLVLAVQAHEDVDRTGEDLVHDPIVGE